MTKPRRIVLGVLAVSVWAAVCGAAAAPVKVAPELAERIAAARDDLDHGRPAQAIARLKAYQGEDSPLRHLLLGHAYVRADDLPAAAQAYRRALSMDPGMTQAGLALAGVYARQEKWPAAADLLGTFADVNACGADVLYLYAQVARQMADYRLGRLLTDKGVVRFPADGRFRRMDLDLLMVEKRYARAGEVAMDLLAGDPADPLLWRQAAAAYDRTGPVADRLAALEALTLCRPDDLEMRRRFLATCLAEGDWLTVVTRGRALLSGPLAKAAAGDVHTMELLVAAADMGRRDALLAAWIERVPDAARTRAIRLASARLALREGQADAARAALRTLIAAGEADASVLLWAAHLAERAGDDPEAETLYTQAARSTGSSARLAVLYLARLHLRRHQAARAVRLLGGYLNTTPEDAAARALLAQAEAAMAASTARDDGPR